MKIGFFDSGLGGLTILRAVTQRLPEYDYEFYGDTENIPYGDRAEDEIYHLTTAAIEYLFAKQCVLVVVACNTASAETLRKLQDEFLPTRYPDRRILGVIIPTIEALCTTQSTNALLIATSRTVESKKYERELELNADASAMRLYTLAMPTLVPHIEAGRLTEATSEVLHVIERMSKFDTLVLGCTHYTELKLLLREELLKRNINVRVLSQDEIIPEKLADYLNRHPEIEQQLSRGYTRSIHLTSHRPDYDRIAAQLLHGAFVSD
jgi:glutamate racemase